MQDKVPGPKSYAEQVAQFRFSVIGTWIKAQKGPERDYIILGGMNIEDAKELAEVTPAGYKSLNGKCLTTNTNVRGPKPYDHVMVNPKHSSEAQGFHVIDLVKAMGVTEYEHNPFRALTLCVGL